MQMNTKNRFPRVLVISHNCFSLNSSNGRTLSNFFINWPKKALAQFYINNEIPDSGLCNNYFRVTDTEALKAFYKGSSVGSVITNKTVANDLKNQDILLKNVYRRHRRRTSFNYIVRNLIWDSKRWRSKEFEKWIDDFSPEVVLLQLGDYAFMLRIALEIAKNKNIPLLIYNSEDYYFKDRHSLSPLYHYYRYDYKQQVRKLISYASHSIYISDMLKETYEKEFQHRATVIMTSTNMKPAVDKGINSPFVVSYLGNLGVGRHKSLIEIADALHEVAPDVYLDIYGKLPNDEVEKALTACTSIRIKGFVSYEEVVGIMKYSDLLVHTENFSDFYQWDLKHAFSTKIADSLGSGTCFFVYAPENIACTKYLQVNKAACLVTNKRDLKESLKSLITDIELRQSYIDTALQVANSRHNASVNAGIFKSLICQITKR
jgi:hypothetical protein